MICPKCKNKNTKVVDSRLTKKNRAIRRRRECNHCNFRFSTLEEVRILELNVEKRNGRIIPFSEEKLRFGVKKSFNKRNINNEKIDLIVEKVIDEIIKTDKNPIKSTKIGKLVLKILKNVDEAAYISFMAMFENFDTTSDFYKLLQEFEENKNKD